MCVTDSAVCDGQPDSIVCSVGIRWCQAGPHREFIGKYIHIALTVASQATSVVFRVLEEREGVPGVPSRQHCPTSLLG